MSENVTTPETPNNPTAAQPPKQTHRVRNGIVGGSVLALVLAVVLSIFNAGSVSANYRSETQVAATASAGNLVLTAYGSLNFANLEPGKTVSQSVQFCNYGSVDGDELTIGAPLTINTWNVPAGQTPDWNQIKLTVPGHLNATSVAGLPNSINIGSIPANSCGDPVVFQLTFVSAGNNAAGDAKDNQFQNVSVSAYATGVLRS